MMKLEGLINWVSKVRQFLLNIGLALVGMMLLKSRIMNL